MIEGCLYKHKNCTDLAIEVLNIEKSGWFFPTYQVQVSYYNLHSLRVNGKPMALNMTDTLRFNKKQLKNWVLLEDLGSL